MDIVLINASPRGNGNSGLIAGSFAEGVARAGARCELYCLADRSLWGKAGTAICRGAVTVFVLPLFVEGVPGIMMEFLEGFAARLRSDTCGSPRNMAFILHSGFPEACQRRCCEQYLKKLPDLLQSRYAGILSRGDTFFLSCVEPDKAAGLLDAYRDMGQEFAAHGGNFFFSAAEAFTGTEYFTAKEARYHNRMAGLFLEQQAQKRGCRVPLTDAPYEP